MKKELNEVEKINAICFYLIDICIETNAEKLVLTQANVIKKKKKLGNWEITIKKISNL